ncbi:hypothetical protein D9619_012907 [Psilocybe cf. subviscida]|uniref:Uncharacterized protein n=1 Tax=Psilocybe cf. subviscida TaxID=2480587 RepID=A0A8H5BJ32_9AGAR|nr:hypothetical protein D9619_012907 [Psilocybe cf. subviscida]
MRRKPRQGIQPNPHGRTVELPSRIDTARTLVRKQDKFCEKVAAGEWDALRSENQDKDEDPKFPEDLQWEDLVDVAINLDGIVRFSNEFSFLVGSFNHAGETYLAPDLLQKTWMCTFLFQLPQEDWKKREAYRGSEFAPRVLAEHGIPVVMKAHYYGLDPIPALASVTSTPAKASGLGYQIGSVAEDLVLWDSHPLALGATPTQVFIDGITQLPRNAPVLRKSHALQGLPKVPNFDKEKKATVEWQGEIPLRARMIRASTVKNNTRADGFPTWVIHDSSEFAVEACSVMAVSSCPSSPAQSLGWQGKFSCA